MVADEEKKLGLNLIYFDTFERCVKRFGYRRKLSYEMWDASYSELKVKLPKPKVGKKDETP